MLSILTKNHFSITECLTLIINLNLFSHGNIKSNWSSIWLNCKLGRRNKKAVAQAAKSLKNIRSVYVQEQSASVKDNEITEFRVNLKLTFEIE